jgi:sulfur-oxidizing protein SoxZ
MAENTIKIKATFDEKARAHVVKSIIRHPMETGLRKDANTGQLIPALYIQEVVCEHNGKPVLTADWGFTVSRDPYLAFKLRGAKTGDRLAIRWVDNTGDKDAAEIVIA